MTEKIATPEQARKRERLSDEEVGNLLAAVGNHEAKAIALILMRSGNIYDRGNLHREILNAQGENKGWRMHNSVPFEYCYYSLAPIGLVAKEVFGPDLSTFGYAITPYGQEVGIPLAGLLLDFSERYIIPLNLSFGSTESSSQKETIQTEGNEFEFKKRAPLTTLKIFYELLTSPSLPIREVDLGERIGEHYAEVVSYHLARLAKLHLIEYAATEVNKPYSLYKLSSSIPEGELPIYRHLLTLTKSIFDIFKKHPDQYLTLENIYGLLSQEQKDSWKEKKLLPSSISGILSFLAKHKYIDIEKFRWGKRSEINLTQEQRMVLTELLEVIRWTPLSIQ